VRPALQRALLVPVLALMYFWTSGQLVSRADDAVDQVVRLQRPVYWLLMLEIAIGRPLAYLVLALLVHRPIVAVYGRYGTLVAVALTLPGLASWTFVDNRFLMGFGSRGASVRTMIFLFQTLMMVVPIVWMTHRRYLYHVLAH
jgi:hypothetical protein